MVKNITAFGRSGLSDWFVQRITSLIVASYVFFLLGYIGFCYPVGFSEWVELFSCLGMRIYTLVVLISLLIHAWIGMWTIATDYVKPACLRAGVEVLIIIALLVYLLWGIYLLFGM